MTKVCTKCKEEKDESAFGKDKHARDGMTHQCKVCRAENSRAWDKNNRERRNEREREWRNNNKDKVREYNQRQYWKDPEKRREANREWVRNNPEKVKECSKRKYDERKVREGLGDRDKHKMSRTITYSSWNGMIRRCTNPNHKAYHNYGGRGIFVCEKWKEDFLNFLEDMGERPSKDYSLDRINVNGGYEPDNCRWATKEEQYNNRRNTRWITYNGQTHTIKEWAEILGVPTKRIRSRKDAGMVDEEIISGMRGEIIYPDQDYGEEVWKKCCFPGFEDKAWVSSYGQVYIDTRGLGKRNTKPRYSYGYKSGNGYLLINTMVDRKQFRASIHQLVATAFIDPNGYEKGLIVHHIDGNRENNHVNNLCFCGYEHNGMYEQSEKAQSS